MPGSGDGLAGKTYAPGALLALGEEPNAQHNVANPHPEAQPQPQRRAVANSNVKAGRAKSGRRRPVSRRGRRARGRRGGGRGEARLKPGGGERAGAGGSEQRER